LNSVEKSAQNIINHFSKQFENAGFTISVPQKELYSYNITLEKDNNKIKLLVYFGKKGNKFQVQGNPETPAFKEVNSLVFGEKLFQEDNKQIKEPENYIGTDESGKGDFSGFKGIISNLFFSKDFIFIASFLML